ncbi:MAG: lipopolysaccharide heptosyltransferase II [Acidobacteria bacterium]|nr:lipopolysaccharide heptosyltransferase II [Acidobacteriota bacterium]
MSLPALRAVRARYPAAEITVLALDWVADLYHRELIANEIIPYPARRGAHDLGAKHRLAKELAARNFDAAILFQNALEAALLAWHAHIPIRAGYNRDGRGMLLTHAVSVPRKGEIPPHESYYYLELARRLGVVDSLPAEPFIRLRGNDEARQSGLGLLRQRGFDGAVIGISPGAAYGTAKRWFPQRFADAAAIVAREKHASVVLFGSKSERELCESVAASLSAAHVHCLNLAGATTLREFIDMTAACRLMLTNDSGAMHIASALGIPTVTVFGATDWIATAPTGPLARIVRHEIECAPCLKRECPLGHHRCMELVRADEVARTALDLLK